MTNTGVHIPTDIAATLTKARNVELVKRYIDEAQLQGLAADEAFCGADLVLLRGDYMLAFEVANWYGAEVRLTLSRILPTEVDMEIEDLWSVRLVGVPWQLFSSVLTDAIRELSNPRS